MSERSERGGPEAWVAMAFVVSILAALGLAIVYSVGGQPQLEGTFLALALGGIGVGTGLWAKKFMPGEDVTEARGTIASTDEEVAAFTRSFQEGERTLERRHLLVRTGLGALAALGVAALFPLRSLGPRPGRGLKRTVYAEGGLRLVDEDGRAFRPDDIATGGLVTAFPEGHIDAADTPTLVIRPTEPVEPVPGREDWTVDGVIAYSKLCTHLGCPVGLYEASENLLLCPCHQSTFDVLEGARPTFGPATRPLPQLPLAVDGDGFLIAGGDFSDPVGGGFWDRDK